jgi:hypothetical protein
MAKVKSSGLRNYVGRLGGSVYYMLKGQNIAREKAPEVSNPRTATQMRQRMQWANLVAMYKCLQPYLGKKAFQNKPATWSDYNAFMSANLGATTVYMTKEMVQHGNAILAPYKVTEGSLPTIGGAYRDGSNAFDTDINLGGNFVFDDTTTIGALSERIIGNNAGWQNGDQLGIIIMQNGRMYRPYTHAFEIILDPSDESTIAELLKYDDLFLSNNGTLSIDVDVLENPTQGLAKAISVIHSRTISGKTTVSTQYLVLNPSGMTEYNEATTDDAFNNARESYGLPTEVWLDAGYQGTRGGAVLPNLIQSFTGNSQPDDTGATIPFTITDGGANTFTASDSTAQDTATYVIMRLLKPLEAGGEYICSFLPNGNPDNSVNSMVIESTGVRVITFKFSRESAVQIQGKAGVFCLVNSDVYEVENLIAEIEVVAP